MAVEKHHQPLLAVHMFLGFIWFVVKLLQIYPLTLSKLTLQNIIWELQILLLEGKIIY